MPFLLARATSTTSIFSSPSISFTRKQRCIRMSQSSTSSPINKEAPSSCHDLFDEVVGIHDTVEDRDSPKNSHPRYEGSLNHFGHGIDERGVHYEGGERCDSSSVLEPSIHRSSSSTGIGFLLGGEHPCGHERLGSLSTTLSNLRIMSLMLSPIATLAKWPTQFPKARLWIPNDKRKLKK